MFKHIHTYLVKTMKHILYTFTLSLFLIFGAYAQETSTLGVVADVLANITVTTIQEVDFGNIQSTSDPVLDPSGSSTADVGQTSAFGEITITASNSTQLYITWDASKKLGLDGGDSEVITFTPNVYSHTDNDRASSSSLSNGSSASTSGSGKLYLFVGGNLGKLSGQKVGSYDTGKEGGEGDLTFTVNYN